MYTHIERDYSIIIKEITNINHLVIINSKTRPAHSRLRGRPDPAGGPRPLFYYYFLISCLFYHSFCYYFLLALCLLSLLLLLLLALLSGGLRPQAAWPGPVNTNNDSINNDIYNIVLYIYIYIYIVVSRMIILIIMMIIVIIVVSIMLLMLILILIRMEGARGWRPQAARPGPANALGYHTVIKLLLLLN